jgi:hypothetical protein
VVVGSSTSSSWFQYLLGFFCKTVIRPGCLLFNRQTNQSGAAVAIMHGHRNDMYVLFLLAIFQCDA